MQALSVEARAAISAGTFGLIGRVDLYRGTELLRSDVALNAADPGSVDVDETAAVLRSCTLNFAPDEDDELLKLIPLLGGPLEPTGVEAHVYTDLLLPDGTLEVIGQGVFGLRSPQASDNGAPIASATGRDRSQRLIDAELTAPYDIPSGVNIATAIHDLFDSGVPGLTYAGFDEASTGFSTTATLHFADGDKRWDRGVEMAASAGRELRFQPDGSLLLRPVPDTSTDQPTWNYVDGPDNLADEVSQTLDADQTYSHAAVLSQPLDGSPPFRADAFDNDPTSPTFFQGPFGDRVVRLVSSFIGSQEQANEAAAALLRRKRGLLENVTLTAAPIVAHEDADVIYLKRDSLGIDAFYVLSKFAIPLGPAVMSFTTRSRRVTT